LHSAAGGIIHARANLRRLADYKSAIRQNAILRYIAANQSLISTRFTRLNVPVSAAKIEIGPPKLLTTASVFVINAYGLLLIIPFLVSVLAISLLKFGLLTWLIPVGVVVATAYLLPFALGNARIVKLVRSLNAPASKAEDCFVVQLTCSPRIRSGIRALLEDADDIGCLSFTGSELVFHGDSVKLSLPFDQIVILG
jgi:hypothetical protein